MANFEKEILELRSQDWGYNNGITIKRDCWNEDKIIERAKELIQIYGYISNRIINDTDSKLFYAIKRRFKSIKAFAEYFDFPYNRVTKNYVNNTKAKEKQLKITWDYDSIKNYVENNNCILLITRDEFNKEKIEKSSVHKVVLRLKCICGQEFNTAFQNFNRKKKPKTSCDDCYDDLRGGSNKKIITKTIDGESVQFQECSKCKNTLLTDEFHLDKSNKTGLTYICRKCCGYEKKVDLHPYYKDSSDIVGFLDNDFLFELKIRSKLRQSQLSKLLGISQSTLSRIECGEMDGLKLKTNLLEKITENLNLSYENIIKKDFTNLKVKQIDNKISYVYFIKEYGGNHIKIGSAKEPNKRIPSIQTSNPFKIEILKIIKGNRKLELDLHKKFNEFRIAGTEWFKPYEELTSFIDKLENQYDIKNIILEKGVK